ncbi:pyridoxal phosphate-dependent decarboxylase family protein [Dactylosporangium fulvum]|uniref:Pyridoxal-dependent decarboxylase n=1 Tax=Dactylosporangium fulvum TaxID=53359 RepID=A0ABY5VS38_9ACTN|nr:pyridoxal-dependent decarboxylase [Dactylosporangium fulvum]UWP79896.1 pyridoxal-dependent decarboxylase [Dactylosporangium fulvum]
MATAVPGAPSPALFAGTGVGLAELRTYTDLALDLLAENLAGRSGPVPPGGPGRVGGPGTGPLSEALIGETGQDARTTFVELIRAFAGGAVDLNHAAAVARMQCPPLAPAVAAEVVVAALNQSLHAWESGPSALELDRWVVEGLAAAVGYGPASGGTLTAGGSVSNLMGLLAAREWVLSARQGTSTFGSGLAGLGARPVVLCSDSTHFSVARAVGVVGIGTENIVRLPSDEHGRIRPDLAEQVLIDLPPGTVPVALVACAGTTDFGWVDPLPELAVIARRRGVWLHVDAAYGGGAIFSDRLRPMLRGIAEADSVTLDLHKFGWVPASASALLVRSAASLDPLAGDTTTLNAEDDRLAGYHGRYGSSLQATRRVDALKIAVALRTLGRRGIGEMVDACHALACHAADRIAVHPRLELADRPVLSTVVFRYLPDPGVDADAFNAELRRRLMAAGTVLTARTRVPRPDGTAPVFLKLMLLNPATTAEQLDGVVADVLAGAAELSAAHPAVPAAGVARP